MQTIVENAAIAARMFDLFNKGEIAKLISLMHPNVTWIVSGSDPISYAGTYKGQHDTARFFSQLAKTVHFTEFEADRILNADEHTVVSIGHFKGKVAATGKAIQSDWVMVMEFDEEGLLVHFHDYTDTQNVANAFK